MSIDAGSEAENAALAYLQRAGLSLVARNFRCRRGEIDLVMLEGNVLVLVEVRYRSSDQYGGAAASVTYAKQRRLIEAARVLLATRADLRAYPVRFDVVAISARHKDVLWIKHAFELR
jgi:putative endonuclease